MKIAHLILAHNNPGQLTRLINRLQHPDADIYIHLDLKADIEPFLSLANTANVYLIKKRVKVYWGAYSMVRATLNGFSEILATGKPYDYVNLLSGQDYPIKSIPYIHQFLSDNPDKIFMEYLTEDSEWWKNIKTRVTEYHLTDFPFKGNYNLQTLINKIIPKRKAPDSLKFVGRSQWLTITIESVKYLIEYIDNYPKVRRYFRLTWGADEIMLQTILYNSPFKESIVNNNLRYIDWSEQSVSPKVLTIDDAEKITSSPCLFARKFDMNTHPEILNYLDNKF